MHNWQVFKSNPEIYLLLLKNRRLVTTENPRSGAYYKCVKFWQVINCSAGVKVEHLWPFIASTSLWCQIMHYFIRNYCYLWRQLMYGMWLYPKTWLDNYKSSNLISSLIFLRTLNYLISRYWIVCAKDTCVDFQQNLMNIPPKLQNLYPTGFGIREHSFHLVFSLHAVIAKSIQSLKIYLIDCLHKLTNISCSV